MTNKFSSKRHRLIDMLSINSHSDFHKLLFSEAINRYSDYRKRNHQDLGDVIACCANIREAVGLREYNFNRIVLTGIGEPSEELKEEISKDSRLQYIKENAESLNQSDGEFDLVICKEGIHHLARPVLGVYEMLRVTNSCAIIIEPGFTWVGSILEALGKSSVYETNQTGNISYRDNYVYRWTFRGLADLLRSYYLESGFTLHVTYGWMSSSINCHKKKSVRILASIIGWLASFIPYAKGNYFSALITIGSDIPERVQKTK